MNDLTAWLRIQLDEDERSVIHGECRCPDSGPQRPDCPDRVLADVAAKRAILNEIFQYEAKIDGEWGCCHSAVMIAEGICLETPPNKITAVRLLATPYADRDGYREEWRT